MRSSTPDYNFPALMTATEQLAALVEEDAKEAEQLFRQTDRVVAALRKVGIYSMLLPRELGGSELAFADAMRIIERLAWADGSAGWCTMVANIQAASAGSHLPPGRLCRCRPLVLRQRYPPRRLDTFRLHRHGWRPASTRCRWRAGHNGCASSEVERHTPR